MNKRIRMRLLVTLAVTLLSVFLFAGFPPSVENMRERIRLGLDLRGGTQLVLQVVTDDAIRAETNQVIESLKNQLQTENIAARQFIPLEVDRFSAVGVDPGRDADFRRIMADYFPDWEIVSTAGDVPNTYTLRLNARAATLYRDQSVDQAFNTIRNRVDSLGVTEPMMTKYGGAGDHRLLVQFPGVDDPARVKGIIQSTAMLEFKLVEGPGPYINESAALADYGGALPGNLQVMQSSERGPDGNPLFYVVHRVAAVTGRDLKHAFPSRDDMGRPVVNFSLTADGGQKFDRFTGDNVGRLLAIVLDNRIQSAPVINSRISDSGTINGGGAGFNLQEAQDLALVLRSGALPASITYLHETLVGPTLGADSIRQGVTASIVSLISVIIFLLFYYRLAGVNAAIAMVLNLLFLLGCMAYFGATLTLPGIAGIILTIGIGIDSNILIFERIREELRSGKAAAVAVTTSFKRVFITLVDTHLTSLIAAAFLFLFGSDAVRGFAVTLTVGLIGNMFTAVFVSRTMFEILLARKGRAEVISI